MKKMTDIGLTSCPFKPDDFVVSTDASPNNSWISSGRNYLRGIENTGFPRIVGAYEEIYSGQPLDGKRSKCSEIRDSEPGQHVSPWRGTEARHRYPKYLPHPAAHQFLV
jgi:hypothetical protein